MAVKTHVTKSGRTVIELDGRSDYYSGALMQGAVVCKISVPAGANVDRVIHDLPCVPNAGPRYIEAIREAVPGIRVLEWDRVQ